MGFLKFSQLAIVSFLSTKRILQAYDEKLGRGYRNFRGEFSMRIGATLKTQYGRKRNVVDLFEEV